MIRLSRLLAAATAAGAIATPALAQYPTPYPQQPYPPQQTYPGQPVYGQNPIQQIVDQLLGNRYNVTDRTAVQHCATAAVAQTSAQYRPRGYGQNGQGYGQYGQGYNQYGQPVAQPYAQQGYPNAYGARVTAITDVQRNRGGLRVSGVIDSGRFGPVRTNPGYYNQQGYSSGMASVYAARSGDLTFRCNVDYRGAVTNLRVRQNPAFRR